MFPRGRLSARACSKEQHPSGGPGRGQVRPGGRPRLQCPPGIGHGRGQGLPHHGRHEPQVEDSADEGLARVLPAPRRAVDFSRGAPPLPAVRSACSNNRCFVIGGRRGMDSKDLYSGSEMVVMYDVANNRWCTVGRQRPFLGSQSLHSSSASTRHRAVGAQAGRFGA